MKKLRKRSWPALALLLLLLLLLSPFSTLLPGFLAGGDRHGDDGGKTPRTDRDGTLRVTVVKQRTGAPLAGALILVRGRRAFETVSKGAFFSDENGVAEVPGLGRGRFLVEAHAGSESASQWHDMRTGSEVRLRVSASAYREGQVTTAGGRPRKAVVHLIGADGKSLASAETDEDGRYRLPEHEDAVSVCAQPEGGPPVAGSGGSLIVGRSRTLSGRIDGAQGGVITVFGLTVSSGSDRPLMLRAKWNVDGTGAFAGQWPEDTPAWALYKGAATMLPSQAGQVITLPPRVLLSGRVTCESEAVPHALVSFRPLLADDFPPPLPAVPIRANKNGEFAVDGFPMGRYLVRVEGAGCAMRLVHDIAVSGQTIELALKRGFSMRGHIHDGKGIPVRDATVLALGMPDEQNERPPIHGRTDADGRFELHGLGGTHARLHITATGFQPLHRERVAPGDVARLTLERR